MNNPIINFGSINIDHVYQVRHFVQPGETLSTLSLETGLGGKGANQSVAIAKAGCSALHVGQLSSNDQWALDLLQENGVDTQHIKTLDQPSGHAIIQVDARGENCILLHGGANQTCDLDNLSSVLDTYPNAEYLLLQNECNGLAQAIDLAHQRGIRVALNPAPMNQAVLDLSLDKLSVLIVNQGEAEGLSGARKLSDVIDYFQSALADTLVVLTLGAKGAVLLSEGEKISVSAHDVVALDTTGAGDTFVGYFLAALAQGETHVEALQLASAAAALAVTKAGAINAIPSRAQAQRLMNSAQINA